MFSVGFQPKAETKFFELTIKSQFFELIQNELTIKFNTYIKPYFSNKIKNFRMSNFDKLMLQNFQKNLIKSLN